MTSDPRLGSHLPHPERGENGRESERGRNRREKSVQALQEPLLQQSCVPPWMAFSAEIVAAWSVEDGVRVVWEVAKMVVVVVVKVVVGLIQNNNRTEKRLSQRVAAR